MPEPITTLVAVSSLALGGASWLYRNRGEVLSAAVGFRVGRLAAREGAQVGVLLRGGLVLAVGSLAVVAWTYRDVLGEIEWSGPRASLAAGLTVLGYKLAGWIRGASDHLLTAGVAVVAGRLFEAVRPQPATLGPVRTGALLVLMAVAAGAATSGVVRAHDEVRAYLLPAPSGGVH